MHSGWKRLLLLLFLFVVVFIRHTDANSQRESSDKVRASPHENMGRNVIDGSGVEKTLHDIRIGDKRGTHNKVSVSTVALFTLAMAAATGLGAVPFFFVELDPQWAGICNGMAAGVMLAASFDLVKEGQEHGSGNWVVTGILAGGLFIWLCQQFLEQYGEVSMLDIKGADAAKVVLVIGIMTLHSFGEGSGVGVSFAGSKGFSQGLLVTLAIAVHNIPEGLAVSMVLASRGVSPQNAMLWSIITSLPQPIVAVPAFLCADAFSKFLPFCTGFAAGCMIWMVIAEVLPDAFKEASPSHVASAATISVASMEALSTLFESFTHDYSSEDASGFFVSLLFGLGPLLGGVFLVVSALTFRLQHALLMGVASGIAFVLGLWRPLQLLLSAKMGFIPLFSLLAVGAILSKFTSSTILNITCRKKSRGGSLITPVTNFPTSVITLQSLLACGAVAFHALAEGLALGVAAPKAYGLGRHMVLPVSLHGLPRGTAVASCVFGATDSWHAALAAAALIGFVGPVSAIGSILAGIDYSGLDHVMVVACGALLPSFGEVIKRAVRLERRKGSVGMVLDKPRPSLSSRPSTPTRPQLSTNSPGTIASRPNSRPSTPTRRSPSTMVSAPGSNILAGRVATSVHTTPSSSRPSSPGSRVRTSPQQPIALADFPLDTPPNLRTTLPDRPISAGRSRPVTGSSTVKASPEPKGPITRRNSSPIVTRGRLTETQGNGRFGGNIQHHLTDAPEPRRISNVSDVTSRRTLKTSSTVMDNNNGLGRSLSKSSLNMAIRHMDIRSGKANGCAISTTTLFPQSIRPASSKIQPNRSGNNHLDSISSNGTENGSETNEGRRLLGKLSDMDMYESSRYDALLLKEDVKNTNWLHSIDDRSSDYGLMFDNGGFELLPEPFAPL